MKIAIVDDDPKDRRSVELLVRKYFAEEGQDCDIALFEDAVSFLKSYRYEYQLIILDIDMPGLGGIDASKKLRERDPDVVLMFVTNMPQYALDGFSVDAVDYIVKPVSYPEFRLKMMKAMRYICAGLDRRIAIRTTDGTMQIAASDIRYIESQLHYVIFHTVNGNLRARASLRDIEPKLSDLPFARCSASYLVNLRFVDSMHGDDLVVGGDLLRISRGKKQEFLSAFTRYIGGLSK